MSAEFRHFAVSEEIYGELTAVSFEPGFVCEARLAFYSKADFFGDLLMRKRIHSWQPVLLGLILIGCTEEPRGGPRQTTFPVKGTVLLDGAPRAGISVYCNPQSGSSVNYPLTDKTDADGKFAMSTYVSGDGVPEGTYVLTFELEEGKSDLLNGAYADVAASQWTVSTAEAPEFDLGTIELTTP